MPSLDLGPVVGPQGEQGATGAQGIRGEQGLPGPNQVTNSTATPLTGILTGNGSVVGVANIDAAPTEDSTGFAQSGGTDKAIKGRVPVYGLGKNLLRNWGFHVNQRGKRGNATSYSYTVDGWYRGAGNGTCTVNNDDTITLDSSGGYVPFIQNIDLDVLEALVGKRVTVSVLLQSGELLVSTLLLLANRENLGYVSTSSYIGVDTRTVNHRCYLLADGGDSYTIKCIKLELGTEQTLCHNEGTAEAPVWVLNEIPDYEYELYRCMTSTADSSDTYANKTLATGQELAYVENGTTASKAYASNDYFCWNGSLYKASTAISVGDTLTENTNCYIVNVGNELNIRGQLYCTSRYVMSSGTVVNHVPKKDCIFMILTYAVNANGNYANGAYFGFVSMTETRYSRYSTLFTPAANACSIAFEPGVIKITSTTAYVRVVVLEFPST